MSGDEVTRLHAMMAEACFGPATVDFDADLGGYLARHGVEKEDAEAILASPRRLGLYRQLVRHNVTDVIGVMLERTRARLEEHAPGAFDAAIAGFLAERGPRTPHLRDVPREFVSWVSPRWRGDPTVPPWIADHAELEIVDFTVGAAARPAPPPPLADVTPDKPLVFGEPHVVLVLAFAVHEMPERGSGLGPEPRRIDLLVYRDAEHRTRLLDLTPVAAAILARLFAGRPLAAAVGEGCEASGQPVDESVLAGTARLLADLAERGVLLGARA